MRFALRHRQDLTVVDLQRAGDTYRATVDGEEYAVEASYLDADTLVLTIAGRRHRIAVARNGRDRYVGIGGEAYGFVAETGPAAGHSVATAALPEIVAPMPGKVLEVLVGPGDHVDAGDGLLILEAMKMENRLIADAPATVIEVRVAAGDMVDGGQILIVLEYAA